MKRFDSQASSYLGGAAGLLVQLLHPPHGVHLQRLDALVVIDVPIRLDLRMTRERSRSGKT